MTDFALRSPFEHAASAGKYLALTVAAIAGVCAINHDPGLFASALGNIFGPAVAFSAPLALAYTAGYSGVKTLAHGAGAIAASMP